MHKAVGYKYRTMELIVIRTGCPPNNKYKMNKKTNRWGRVGHHSPHSHRQTKRISRTDKMQTEAKHTSAISSHIHGTEIHTTAVRRLIALANPTASTRICANKCASSMRLLRCLILRGRLLSSNFTPSWDHRARPARNPAAPHAAPSCASDRLRSCRARAPA
jgi:hypothetical protein